METRTDISGFSIFSAGDLGGAHVIAHGLLDSGRYAEGHRLLGAWLEGRRGSGSAWIHLQWHMLVFELAVGAWDDAYARCLQYVVPPGGDVRDAATDAPAALWRLALRAPRPARLPWDVVRAGALTRLHQRGDAYVELHDLLALAGAGDADNLGRWLLRRQPRCEVDRVLARMARGLLAYAQGDFANAAGHLGLALPKLASVGGSRAQNELFFEIYRRAFELADDARRDQRSAPLGVAVGMA